MVLNNIYLNSYNSYTFSGIIVSKLGLNKVNINPIKIKKNTVMHVFDNYQIIPIDTSGTSKYSDYIDLNIQPYVKISYNSFNWRFYFRTVTNKIERITLNKTYDKSGQFNIWAVVNGQKIENLQKIEVLPSKIFYYKNKTIFNILYDVFWKRIRDLIFFRVLFLNSKLSTMCL